MLLQVRDLAFGYGGRSVGAKVSFDLAAGEVLCLLGPNGGGKTTLFKTLLGLLPAVDGRVSLDGVDLSRLSRTGIARAVAAVPQAHAAFFPFTVREVVVMGRASRLGPFSSPGPSDSAAAEVALATLGIGHLADAIYTEISGGERQLALIARALSGEPRLLIMDEPTASLDFGNQARVLGQVAALGAGRHRHDVLDPRSRTTPCSARIGSSPCMTAGLSPSGRPPRRSHRPCCA